MPKVILKFEAAVIKEYPMISSTLTIGRESDNDVPIDHPAVSRHHARIILQGDTYFVEDLNSTNGTLVNDKKIIKAGIHNQDVIAIAKHSLIFVDDRPAGAAPKAEPAAASQTSPVAAPAEPAASSTGTVAPPAEAKPSAPPPMPGNKSLDKIGGIRIIDGVVDQIDFLLTENSTYIGKSDRVAIKIKGLLAPEVAAMISRKPNGYFLVAIKDGYPKINGMPLQGERQLNEGDMIEIGGTKMQFYLKSA